MAETCLEPFYFNIYIVTLLFSSLVLELANYLHVAVVTNVCQGITALCVENVQFHSRWRNFVFDFTQDAQVFRANGLFPHQQSRVFFCEIVKYCLLFCSIFRDLSVLTVY